MTMQSPGENRVFEYLREQILSGKFPPGQHLNVAEVCREIGTSHIPVREAIRRLEGESLVVTVPNRGATVAGVSMAELEEIYQLRRVLELRLVEEAVPKYTDDRLASLEELGNRVAAASPKPSDREFYLLHREFHWAVLLPTPGSWHERMLSLLWQVSERYQRLVADSTGAAEDQIEHHLEIVRAACQRNVEQLIAAVEAHLHLTESVLLDRFFESTRDE